MKKKLHLISRILFNIFAVLFGFAMMFSAMCKNATLVELLSSFVFGKGTEEIITTGKEPVYFKTWYTSVEDNLNGSGAVAAAAEAEGAVLLKNDNNALPLNTATDKVSVFGVTAYNPMYSLDGAGEIFVNGSRKQYLHTELMEDGVTVNGTLADWYNSSTGKGYWRGTTTSNGVNVALNGAPWNALPTAKTATGYNTAIFVTGRMTNEAIDIRPQDVGNLGATNNDYLKFTANELSVLSGLKAAKADGVFNKIIVIFNQANLMQEDMPELLAEYGVDAALWIGFPGSDGLAAVADILVGKTTPSGGLSTTWYTKREANPSTAYFAASSNVIIQEGVYLGYRYAETRYEDYVLGRENAGEYAYGDNISYPFGYGLSYADFSYEIVGLTEDSSPEKENRTAGDDYILKVRVTNNSSVYSGKEIVQVYLQQPYTATDTAHKTEKPSIELVGYAKTSKLAPGASETVSVKIDANKYFAAYDAYAKTYVLEEGEYYLTAARNSHEAVNNILKKKAADGAAVIDETRMDDEYGAGDAALVSTVTVSAERSASYRYWTQGGAAVTNLFDFADPNISSGDDDYVTFMSRADWTGTADELEVQTITLKGDMADGQKVASGSGFNATNAKNYYADAVAELPDEYPSYGQHRDENGNAEVKLVEMRGVEYQDGRGATEEDKAKWEYFLDQLTWEETCTIVGKGLRHTEAIESISKPYTFDVNASNGISWKYNMTESGKTSSGFATRFDGENVNYYPTGYPCEGIIAASFNTDVAYAVGQAIGEDALWSGASGLYGFGLGLHRNPYHGRAGEYYSDDPYLAGVTGGYSSLGAQSKGLYVYNKHFVLNDQETNRTSYNTWLTEQTLRQIYIRPFEIAIEIGDAMNVMNSFNNVGTYWSGNSYNLMTKCLRGELGMRGFAVTDWYKSGGMNMTYGILAGTDLPDGSDTSVANYGPSVGGYGFYAQAVRRSAQRILYTVANSNAMNFYGEGTLTIVHDPAWYSVRDGIITAITVLFALSAAFAVATTGWNFYGEIKAKKSAKDEK